MSPITKSPIKEPEQDKIRRALKRKAKAEGWDVENVVLFFVGAKIRGKDLYIPTRVPGEDAWQRAERLQLLEDAWNESRPERQIVLLPVGVNPDVVN